MSRGETGPLDWAVGTVVWLVGLFAVAPLVGGHPLTVAAQAVVETAPGGLATAAIETLGSAALPALVVVLGVLVVGLGGLVGALERRHSHRGWDTAIVAVGLLAVTAGALYVVAGGVTFGWLLASALALAPPAALAWARLGRTGAVGRRQHLREAGEAAVAVVALGALARVGDRDRSGPQPSEPLSPIEEKTDTGTTTPAGPGVNVTGTQTGSVATVTATPSADSGALSTTRERGEVTLSSANTDAPFGFDFEGMPKAVGPARSHFVVDKNVSTPTVDADAWELTVTGAVDRPVGYAFEDLTAHEDARETAVTTECISNVVGGGLLSTVEWRAIPLRTLLAEAGVAETAVDVVTRATDGYSEALPWEVVREREDVVVAVGMDGATLPRKHGFPARLLIPGRYGMKSTKWLSEIEVVERDHEGYWEQRGWVEEAVVNTFSYVRAIQRREDRVAVGGVAYAGRRGIDRVEVSVDGGETWDDADLEEPPSPHAWRRFRRVAERPAGGAFDVVVRATDGRGSLQTRRETGPHPGGSTGWHSVTVSL